MIWEPKILAELDSLVKNILLQEQSHNQKDKYEAYNHPESFTKTKKIGKNYYFLTILFPLLKPPFRYYVKCISKM